MSQAPPAQAAALPRRAGCHVTGVVPTPSAQMGKLSRVEALAELGLTSADDNDDTIKTAYKRLALQHHPDKAPVAERAAAEDKFKEVCARVQT